ncbi:hypothetical protein ACFQ9Z_16825 [Streptomyces sp. NPDC056580]
MAVGHTVARHRLLALAAYKRFDKQKYGYSKVVLRPYETAA